MSDILSKKMRNPHRQRSLSERVLEIIPATLVWATFFFAIYFSATHPAWAAAYIIVFDVYWVLKAINTTFHLLSAYNHHKHDLHIDWFEEIKFLSDKDRYIKILQTRKQNTKWRWRGIVDDQIKVVEKAPNNLTFDNLYHVVMFPFVNESFELLRNSINGLAQSNYDLKKVILFLATEERAGEPAQSVAQKLKEHFKDNFKDIIISLHPDGLPGEIRGKSANASYAVEHFLLPALKAENIPFENVIISNLDSDTVIHREYLARVTYEWLLAENPHLRSYQPIALYNNNMWDSPALVRVIHISNSFWQFMESSRPDRLRTFSSHSMSLKTLIEVGYWKKDIVNEDACIFWQCYIHFNGKYMTQPIFIPVSMDTCLADTYKQTLINQYKQKRRWAYNVEYWPWLLPKLMGNKKISLYNRLYKLWQYIEGNYNWATASIMIAVMGFLPSYLGNNFVGTVFGYNLPIATRLMMNVALIFLVFSVYINMVLLPPRPARYKWTRTAAMYAQWAFVPIIATVWGSLPAIEAQTRLALGKYMEFWVTPKSQKIAQDLEQREKVLSAKAGLQN